MQKLKRIKTTLFLPLLFLMVLAFGMLPANQLQVKATTYSCTVKEVTVKIQDLAGNPVSGGNFNFSGIVHDPGNQAGISIAGGNVAYVSDRTVGYTNTNGTVTLKVTIWYSSPNGAVYPQYTGEVSAYSYDTSGILDEFVLPSDSITFTAKDSPTIKLVRKNVGLTVNLKDSSGNEVTGATVTINGQSAQGSGNTFTGLQEGKKYTITVQGDGYNYSTEYTVAKNGQKSRSTDLNVGARTFTLTADVLLGGKTYTGATIYVGGSNQLYWNGSTYSASLPASIYTLTSSSGSGVSITPDNELKSVSLASGDQHITYTATLNTPTIQSYNASAISSLSLNYGGSAYLTPGSTVTGASYTWTSSDSDIFSVSGNAFMGIVTANKVGTANLTLTCSYGTASKSVSIPVTVTKAATASPDAPTPSAADTDITTETFTLPSDLKNATGLTITASLPNGSSKEQSYTLNGQTSVNFSTGSTLQGQVTYNFVYTSDIYDYNTAAASQGKAYYVTKPLSVALYKGDQALTSSASSYTVTYGDTVNIRGTAGTAASNTFTLTSSDSAVIESPGSYTLGTALNAKKAGTVTLTLTRVKDSTAYWAEASASMAITVEPKSLNILEAVFTGSRDYDGTQYITATAVLPGVGNETVTITANLLLSSADADTYNTASIASASLDLSNYAIASYLSTDKINSASSLKVNPKEITVSGITAQNKVYDQTTDVSLSDPTINGLVGSEDLKITVTGAFSDKNAGTGKTVSLTYESVSDGMEGLAKNYSLNTEKSQQTATADITHRILTLTLQIKDKQYDGLSTAEFTGFISLNNILPDERSGIDILPGTPTFTSIEVGEDILISFTDFALADARPGNEIVKNYQLQQPENITASIYNTYDAEEDTDYTLTQPNEYGWLNTDLVITAKEGFVISTANTDDADWQDSITLTGDTADGTFTFYVRNTETKAISLAEEISYKIDTIVPAGTIGLDETTLWSSLQEFLVNLYFNQEQTFSLTGTDDLSGIASVAYYESTSALTQEELEALEDDSWITVSADSASQAIALEDAKAFMVYARITDKAGNVTYLSTGAAKYDITSPEITGVTNEGTYCTSKNVIISDANLASVTLNEEPVSVTDGSVSLTLTGNVEQTYTIDATDKAGNTTTYTVQMQTIESVLDDLVQLTPDNVTPEDLTLLDEIPSIIESIDQTDATEGEKQAIDDLLLKSADLKVVIVEDLIQALPDSIETDLEDETTEAAILEAKAVYDSLSETEKQKVPTDSVTKLTTLLETLTNYLILEGDGSVWITDGTDGLCFTANGPSRKFTALYVDGEAVSSDNYEITQGSTVVTLSVDYLSTLALGKHTLQVLYSDGETNVVSFTIEDPVPSTEEPDTEPATEPETEPETEPATQKTTETETETEAAVTAAKTGDDTPIWIWAAAMLASLLAAGSAVMQKKRKVH